MDLNKTDFSIDLETFNAFEAKNLLIQKLSLAWKIALWFIIFFSLVIGWKTKQLMFQHIKQKSFKDQPINWMILTEEIVHLFCGTLCLTSLLISHTMGLSVGEWINYIFNGVVTDNQYCWIFINAQLLVIVYGAVNGAGMAIVRVLFLVKGNWVRFRIGQRTFFLLSWFSVVAMSTAIMYLFSFENVTSRPLYFICLGRDEHMEVRALIKLKR